MEPPQPIIGLTGGIASGKSSVAEILRGLGHIVIDADQIAREVVKPGSPALARIVEMHGDAILDAQGALKRSALAKIVFEDPNQRKQLESILHPAIAAESARQLEQAAGHTDRPVFYEAALLVETGRHLDFSGLVVVQTTPEVQRSRLMKRDGLSAEEAQKRIDAQLPLEEKVLLADHILDNDRDLNYLQQQTLALSRAIS